MKKHTAILLSLMVLLSSFIIINNGTQNASAINSTTIVPDHGGRIYSTTLGTSFDDYAGDENMQVSYRTNLWSETGIKDYIGNSYLSFDTNSIPDNARIISATMFFNVEASYTTYNYTVPGQYTVSYADLGIFTSDFGTNVNLSDLYSESEQYITTQRFLNNGWTTFTIPTWCINITGDSQFVFQILPEWYENIYLEFTGGLTLSESSMYMQITYETDGLITYTYGSGSTYEAPTNPIVSDFNSTHKLYTLEFDTWGTVTSISIEKGTGWEFYTITPFCTYSDSTTHLNMTSNIQQNITYRAYFLVESIQYSNIYVAVYDSATGRGFSFEDFQIKYNSGATYNSSSAMNLVTNPTRFILGTTYTFTVLDYFGNIIQSSTLTSHDSIEYLSIPIVVESFKTFNQKDDFTKFRIYYENSGTPMSYFCAPMECVERYLRHGDYTIGVTFYDNATAQSTQWFNTTVDDAEFLIIKGDTISMVVSDIEGIYALQEVITTLVSPDIVLVGENMPCTPDTYDEGVLIHPYSIATFTVTKNETGQNITMDSPLPTTGFDSSEIVQDRLFIMGDFSTDLLVKDSGGNILYNGTNLPAFITLDGEEINITASADISVARETRIRTTDLFYFTYYQTSKRYEVTLSLNNTMAEEWTLVSWSIGFPENRTIDTASVSVYDINNEIYLEDGRHYEVTTSSIRMSYDIFASGLCRTFKIVCYDLNSTNEQPTPIAYVDAWDRVEYNGDNYYHVEPQWTNSYVAPYSGSLIIKMNFEEALSIDTGSIIVYDRANDRVLSEDEWFYSGNGITISNVQTTVGGVVSYDVYFKVDYSQTTSFSVWDVPFLFSWVIWFGLVVVVFGAWGLLSDNKESRTNKLIVSGCVLAILAFMMMLEEMGAF